MILDNYANYFHKKRAERHVTKQAIYVFVFLVFIVMILIYSASQPPRRRS